MFKVIQFVSQAFSTARFFWQYAIPVSVFAFCYGRIFHTFRRQSKVVGGQAGRSQSIAMITTSRDQNAGQVQRQSTASTNGNKLSRTELNILQTMITVVACFMICWTVSAIANFLQLLGVSICMLHIHANIKI